MLSLRPFDLRALSLRTFNLRRSHLRSFGAPLALHRSLARLRAWGSRPRRIRLALNALAVLSLLFARRLRLLAMLTHLIVRPLPALERRFALPLLIELASLMLELTLQLSFTYLPVAILTHPLGQRAPIEYRSRVCAGGADSPTGRSTRGGRSGSIADDGRSSIGFVWVWPRTCGRAMRSGARATSRVSAGAAAQNAQPPAADRASRRPDDPRWFAAARARSRASGPPRRLSRTGAICGATALAGSARQLAFVVAHAMIAGAARRRERCRATPPSRRPAPCGCGRRRSWPRFSYTSLMCIRFTITVFETFTRST